MNKSVLILLAIATVSVSAFAATSGVMALTISMVFCESIVESSFRGRHFFQTPAENALAILHLNVNV